MIPPGTDESSAGMMFLPCFSYPGSTAGFSVVKQWQAYTRAMGFIRVPYTKRDSVRGSGSWSVTKTNKATRDPIPINSMNLVLHIRMSKVGQTSEEGE